MIRSLLFKIIFYFGVIILCILFSPALFLPKTIASFAGRMSGYWVKFCVQVILSTKIEIIGLENIDNSKKFFVACTHQSAFETFFLQTIFRSPFFIIKKELMNIPIFGLFLKKIGCVYIERDSVKKENINFLDKVNKEITSSKYPLIIFPQGSRYGVLDRPKFKKGVSRIYNLKINCLPIVMNSGIVWPKRGYLKSNKTIKISIMKLIEPGIERSIFLSNLENEMYKELDGLI